MEEKLRKQKMDDRSLIQQAMRNQQLGISQLKTSAQDENLNSLKSEQHAAQKIESFQNGY